MLFNSGVKRGKKSMYPVVLGALVVGAVGWECVKALRIKLKSLSVDSETDEELQAVEEELIRGIKEYDAQQTAEQDNEEQDNKQLD